MDSNKENTKTWNKLYYQNKIDRIQFAQGVAEATLLYGCKPMEVYTKEELQELYDIYNMVFTNFLPKAPTALLNDKLEFRWGCPTCGEVYNTSLIFKYCPECGQAIDWRKTI